VYLTVGVTTILAAVALISTIWGHYRLGYSGPRVYRRKKVVAFGDSITQHGFNTDAHGWIAKLADWWTRRVDVLNRGYSGYNSRWAKIIFEEVILAENPDFLFIFFGANDAIEETALHHVPLAEYSENIRYMVKVAKQRFPTMSIVLITPPPIYEEALLEANRAKGRGLDRTNERFKSFSSQICLVSTILLLFYIEL
jgi:lysophospholipase L1-like esterase